ncbi:exported hypothetical protein [Crenothrix polyspora]|uniref:Uncharacterized protein n=1 Tax=Crenothrix polyspora TaxID=360316 RepID=A0A1R4H1C8_9GAMM|nr:hypothetical protein [Crenothrix polyspora]SJM90067.1 exported hypothetical protein [Crenothrix polyspora]
MNTKTLLSALIVGLFAASAAQATVLDKPGYGGSCPDDSFHPPKPAPSYEYCFKAKPVKNHGSWDQWGKLKPKEEAKSDKVKVNGKWFELGDLHLICVEPAAPVVTPPPAGGDDCKPYDKRPSCKKDW